MKSLVGKFGTLALLAAVGGFAVQGCSSDITSPSHEGPSAEGDAGMVTLNLVPIAGITINSVNYVVTGTPAIAGTPLPAGTLPTPGTSNTFTVGLSVPVGTGYTLSLTGVSAETGDDVTCTGSYGPFDVTPNTNKAFPMTLTCVDNSNGGLIATVDVKTNACPKIVPDYASAIPAVADVNGNIALNALGHDLDGKVVSYAWSLAAADAAVGTFTNATSAAATFKCTGPGDNIPVTVTLKNGECTKTLVTTVSCKSLTCGNTAFEPGAPTFEDCDPSIAANQPGGSPAGLDGFGCPADCKVQCGDGVLEGPTEQCELNGGPPTAACTAQCRNRGDGTCGDGFIIASGGEVCDTNDAGADILPAGTPAGSTCAADCKSITTPSCGDGFVTAAAGEECELPNTASCGYNCKSVASEACVTCEAGSNCAPFATACLTSAGTTTPADQAKCFDVEECIQRTNCADGTDPFTACFCGKDANGVLLTTGACSALPDTGPDAPKGLCHDEIKAGMGQTAVVGKTGPATNSEVLARITTRSFPSGAGINRYNCLKNNPLCKAPCGF